MSLDEAAAEAQVAGRCCTYRTGEFNRPKVDLRLRNTGSGKVTIDKVRMHIPRLYHALGNGTKKIARKYSTDISYKLSVDCGAGTRGAVTVRIRVHGTHQTKRWVTGSIPLAA